HKGAASVNLPMRRTIFLALLATLMLLAPAAAHAAGPTTIIKDCEDDGVLEGHYTTAELRNARAHLPADVDEYSDCSDVLSRAIAASTSSDSKSSGGGNGGGGGGGGGGTSGGSSGGSGGGQSHPQATPTPPPAPLTPQTPQDQAAL